MKPQGLGGRGGGKEGEKGKGDRSKARTKTNFFGKTGVQKINGFKTYRILPHIHTPNINTNSVYCLNYFTFSEMKI